MSIGRSKATGLDSIPARFANDAAEQIVPTHYSHNQYFDITGISSQIYYITISLTSREVIPLYKRVAQLHLVSVDMSRFSTQYLK